MEPLVRPKRVRTTALLLLLTGVSLVSGCGREGGWFSARQHEVDDSSFVAFTFQRGRSPIDLSMERGRVLYERYCAICHGDAGEGDGFNAYNVRATFGVGPTAFADSLAFALLTEETALTAIRSGGPAVGKSAAMPPWGRTLTAGEVVDVWEWIRGFPTRARGE